MVSHKLSTIAYALGFIDDYVDRNAQPLELTGDDRDQTRSDENEHREQVRAMMAVLNDGLTQLMAENGRLLNKIAMAELTLRS